MMTMPSMQLLLDRAWLRMLLAFCVLFLLHMPFSVLRISPAKDLQDSPGIQLPAVVSLPPVSSQGLSKFERDLHAWSAIADPRRLLHPDLKHGFSRYGDPVVLHPVPAMPVWTLEPYFSPRKDYPESSLAVASKSLAELIREQWNRTAGIFLLPHEKAALPEGVFWRLADSGTGISDLDMPPEFSGLLEKQEEVGKVSSMTLLEVSSLSSLPYPRITVRKSCGNVRFDRMAVLAVKQYLQHNRQQKGGGGNASSQPGRKNWLIEVDWRLPQFGKVR